MSAGPPPWAPPFARSRVRRRRATRSGLTAAVLLLAVGCSQAAALAPVGGNRITEVRFAAIDVLSQQDVAIMTAPVCAMAEDRAVSCRGTTVDGAPITVDSSADDQATMTVSVDGTAVFTGKIQDVLDAAARPTS